MGVSVCEIRDRQLLVPVCFGRCRDVPSNSAPALRPRHPVSLPV